MTEFKKITSYFKSKSGISMCPKVTQPTKKIRKLSTKRNEKKTPPKPKILEYDSDCFVIDEEIPMCKNDMTQDQVCEKSSKNDTSDSTQLPHDPPILLKESIDCEKNIDDIASSQEESENPVKLNNDKCDAALDSIIICDVKSIESTDEDFQDGSRSHQTKENADSTIFFLQMVESFLSDVSLHYLFEMSEIKLIERLHEMEMVESKKVFARMYWIMWKWYKSSAITSKYLKLDYEDKSSHRYIRALQKQGFLLNGADMNLDNWMEVLTRGDLYDVCKHFKISPLNSDRASLIAGLKSFCSPKSTILQYFGQRGQSASIEKNVINKLSSLFGDCVKIKDEAKLVFDKLFKLMYLGVNPAVLREKKLNLFLINIKIGKQCYPVVNLKPDSPSCAFPTRSHFVEYFTAYTLYEEILKLTSTPQCDHPQVIELCRKCCQLYKHLKENIHLITWTPPSWLLRFTPGYCYIKSIEAGIGSFKAQKELYFYEEALQMINILLNQKIYRQHKRALWYNEQALILQSKLRQFQQAANVLLQGLNESEMSEDSKAPLKDRAKRIISLKNVSLNPETRLKLLNMVKEEAVDLPPSVHISARSTTDSAPGRKAQYYFRDVISGEKTFSGVEQYAIIHYLNNTEYCNGEHWEGRIITSIFGLLFWDIIYTPLEAGKGIFLSPYQEAPLDLYTDDFFKNRKDLIENRLVFIEYGWEHMDDIIVFMRETFNLRRTGEVSLFHDSIEWEQIAEIVACLGREGLLSICKRLAGQYYYYHSGFPDLTVWNPKTKKIKFVEVKGDGDRLSLKQIQWMKYLLKSGIPTEVCFVHKNAFTNNGHMKKVAAKKSPRKRRTKKQINEAAVSNLKIQSDDVSGSSIIDCDIVKRKPIPKASPRTPVKGGPDSLVELASPKKTTPKKRKSASPKAPASSSPSGVYLRSPNKISKGVGYFSSPVKSEGVGGARKRLSLSLTKKRIADNDK